MSVKISKMDSMGTGNIVLTNEFFSSSGHLHFTRRERVNISGVFSHPIGTEHTKPR